MTDPKIVINATSFPSQLATDAEKASKEFGLQVGLAVQSEWFRKMQDRAGSTTSGLSSISYAYTHAENSLSRSTKRSCHSMETCRI